MAKDGTQRGGARPGSGRKSDALMAKLVEEKIATKIPSVGFSEDDEKFKDFFKPFLTAVQTKSTEYFAAADICISVYNWLKYYKCESLVQPEMIAQYAIASARWQQCEVHISKKGLMGKHPTTKAEIASPYVSLSLAYQKQANNIWYQIYQIVKENSSETVTGFVNSDDPMEKLLSQGRPKPK